MSHLDRESARNVVLTPTFAVGPQGPTQSPALVACCRMNVLPTRLAESAVGATHKSTNRQTKGFLRGVLASFAAEALSRRVLC